MLQGCQDTCTQKSVIEKCGCGHTTVARPSGIRECTLHDGQLILLQPRLPPIKGHCGYLAALILIGIFIGNKYSNSKPYPIIFYPMFFFHIQAVLDLLQHSLFSKLHRVIDRSHTTDLQVSAAVQVSFLVLCIFVYLFYISVDIYRVN